VVIVNPLPQIPRAQDGNFNPPCLAPEDRVVILTRLAQAPMPGPRAFCNHCNPLPQIPRAQDGNFNPQCLAPEHSVVIVNPLPQIPRAQDGNFNPPCLAPEDRVVILTRLAQAPMPGPRAFCGHCKPLTPDPQSTRRQF
jgi:hypothetical protein